MAREACAPACAAARSATMASFLPFLIGIKNLEISDRSFDAETMGIIGDAFDKACKEMPTKRNRIHCKRVSLGG